METDKKFKQEIVQQTGTEVLTCIQCGTCSASCPTSHLMKPSIRRLIKLVLEGKKEEALDSCTIWLCTSCRLCNVRCPRGIRPKALVDALKNLCEREGRETGKDQAYEEIFLRFIKDYGRVSELPLSGEYIFIHPEAAVGAMRVGLELIQKGKLTLMRDKIKRTEEVKKIITELEKA
ncbi:MAG: 4Fe-4S dicluster domain-containing protein [Methanotrichaceae archaeon]|nr:4Fe-4S dicluster domain-containing protein [Methanotrichaceae archaeon]